MSSFEPDNDNPDGGGLVKTRPTGHGRARGLVSSRQSGDRVQAARFAPREDVSHLVEALWVGEWDLVGQPAHTTELLGDPCVNLAFEIGSHNPGSRVVGVWTDLWRRELADQGRVRGIKLRAGAAAAVLPNPVHQYSNQSTPWTTVFPQSAAVAEQVRTSPDDEAAFTVAQDWLAQHPASNDVTLAVALVERVVSDPSITKVEQLVDISGFSIRPLQRFFRDFVGASPKWLIRRNRLQELALRLEAGQVENLADLAVELGYTDQSHLSRDFKSAVGKSPGAFASAVWR